VDHGMIHPCRYRMFLVQRSRIRSMLLASRTNCTSGRSSTRDRPGLMIIRARIRRGSNPESCAVVSSQSSESGEANPITTPAITVATSHLRSMDPVVSWITISPLASRSQIPVSPNDTPPCSGTISLQGYSPRFRKELGKLPNAMTTQAITPTIPHIKTAGANSHSRPCPYFVRGDTYGEASRTRYR
jgi:hypothetical protein